ncbi:MAG: acyltransferase family protein [Leptolyngbyaceae cyanobacterium]
MSRLVFMDNLRVFLTVLVVAHHAAQPYGPTGGDWPIFNPERAAILGPFFAVNAAFFMGLFFFISGYFLPGAGDRKGTSQLLLDRLRRLGIPVLFFVLVVFPPILYILAAPSESFLSFWVQTYLGQFELEFAHLWFLMHLIAYAALYALWRRFVRRQQLPVLPPPNHGWIVAYVLLLSAVTFGVRIQYPIDRWINLLGILPTEIAHFPQYSSLFVLGILSYRQDWVRQMPISRGLIWLSIGCGAGLLRYLYSMSQSTLGLTRLIATGGWDWRALLWSFWEATICVGLCLGLLVLFRERINFQGRLLRSLSQNAYAVYLSHLVIILYLQFNIADLAVGPLVKFGLVTIIGTPLCFGVSVLLRQLPFVRIVVA